MFLGSFSASTVHSYVEKTVIKYLLQVEFLIKVTALKLTYEHQSIYNGQKWCDRGFT